MARYSLRAKLVLAEEKRHELEKLSASRTAP